ncbi:MAG: T9SS type A sorting domain-containing protein [Prevotellaceae bacterium]|jgi:hypothetical protein|nr:T9SS type A sorting domain-containing protein [Prevotellaceae bacterium]
MWLYTHALDFPNAAEKRFTFSVMGSLLSEEDPSVLELYYVALNENGSLYKYKIENMEFPDKADFNDDWSNYEINLENQPIDDVFFMAFRYYCPAGGASSSQIYYIDNVTWGERSTATSKTEIPDTEIWSANGEINYYTNENQKVTIFDINGKRVGDFNLKIGKGTIPANFANGIYLITNYKNIYKKIILE